MQALSQKLGVSEALLIPGNGSDEILDLAARAFLRPGENAVGADSTFSVYHSVTIAAGAEYKAVSLQDYKHDLSGLLNAVDEKTRIIFICNPNNPTGTYIGSSEMHAFLKKIPGNILILVDQAYCEFADAPDYPDMVEWLEEFPNLLLTRTFSKLYGLAGLRVGYGIGSCEVIGSLAKLKPPFNTSIPAQMAGTAALADSEHIKESLRVNQAGKTFLSQELNTLGFKTLPTQANFICAHIGPNAEKLVAFLESKGMIIRWLRSFGMPEYVRITIGAEVENALLLQLLGEWRKANA
jgi:histidinol-phosphate aminotransferase